MALSRLPKLPASLVDQFRKPFLFQVLITQHGLGRLRRGNATQRYESLDPRPAIRTSRQRVVMHRLLDLEYIPAALTPLFGLAGPVLVRGHEVLLNHSILFSLV